MNTDACVEGCLLATCGDGFVQEGVEECDDGNEDEADGCSTQCTPGVCGNGVLQEGEQCDDGNNITDDDCPACQFAFCGDGYIQLGVEVCDDGNLDNNDGCISPQCVPAECGDGNVWEGMEECDDGNLEPSDDCTDTCTIAVCGDGVWHQGVEECDDGNDVDDDFCSNDCIGDGIYDNFESNSFETLPWQFSGNANWVISTTQPHEGSYVAANGNINDSQTSTLEVTINNPQAGQVQFYYRVSSENNFDYLRFFIDNQEQGGGWSGTVPWTLASYPIGAGQHTLRWTYSKDGSVSSGEDTAYIDEVLVGNP